jgi:YggT family protein
VIVQLLYYIVWIFELLLLARVIIGWIPNIDRSNPLIQLLFDVTEPVLKPVRDLLGQMGMQNAGIDFSPLVLFLIIQVVLQLLTSRF